MNVSECVIDCALFRRLMEFASSYPDTEWGGMLIGSRKDGKALVAACIFPPQKTQHCTFCEFEGREIVLAKNALRESLECSPSSEIKQIVAWVHTHPNLGIFLSGTDRTTFKMWTAFDHEALAVVIDPFSHEKALAFSEELKQVKLSIEELHFDEPTERGLAKLSSCIGALYSGKATLISRDVPMPEEEPETIKLPSEYHTPKVENRRSVNSVALAMFESHIKVLTSRLNKIESELEALERILESRKGGMTVAISKRRTSSRLARDKRNKRQVARSDAR